MSVTDVTMSYRFLVANRKFEHTCKFTYYHGNVIFSLFNMHLTHSFTNISRERIHNFHKHRNIVGLSRYLALSNSCKERHAFRHVGSCLWWNCSIPLKKWPSLWWNARANIFIEVNRDCLQRLECSMFLIMCKCAILLPTVPEGPTKMAEQECWWCYWFKVRVIALLMGKWQFILKFLVPVLFSCSFTVLAVLNSISSNRKVNWLLDKERRWILMYQQLKRGYDSWLRTGRCRHLIVFAMNTCYGAKLNLNFWMFGANFELINITNIYGGL